jgi:hypothetical protein
MTGGSVTGVLGHFCPAFSVRSIPALTEGPEYFSLVHKALESSTEATCFKHICQKTYYVAALEDVMILLIVIIAQAGIA